MPTWQPVPGHSMKRQFGNSNVSATPGIVGAGVLALVLLAGCASTNKPPKLPYPAFVQTDELADMYMAALPGIRAKQYAYDMRTNTTSNRIDFPPGWSGTTGGAPGKSLELYVLSGKLAFSDFELTAGGYAFVPPGSLGFRLETEEGARVLYFLDEVESSAVIRAPLILDSGLLAWTEERLGVYVKELRADPGSGARTWLQRIEPGARVPWQSSSAVREAYFLSGAYRHSECFEGEPRTWDYAPGGYFRRPSGIVNGGPESEALQASIWFFREPQGGTTTLASGCMPAADPPPSARD